MRAWLCGLLALPALEVDKALCMSVAESNASVICAGVVVALHDLLWANTSIRTTTCITICRHFGNCQVRLEGSTCDLSCFMNTIC